MILLAFQAVGAALGREVFAKQWRPGEADAATSPELRRDVAARLGGRRTPLFRAATRPDAYGTRIREQ